MRYSTVTGAIGSPQQPICHEAGLMHVWFDPKKHPEFDGPKHGRRCENCWYWTEIEWEISSQPWWRR